MLVVDEKLRQV